MTRYAALRDRAASLHGLHELNEGKGSFIYSVAKYADNGLAESNAEVEAYLAEYRRRAGVDYLISALEDKSRGFITRFAAQDSAVYKLMKKVYLSFIR
mgnify:CR=1 FL=1